MAKQRDVLTVGEMQPVGSLELRNLVRAHGDDGLAAQPEIGIDLLVLDEGRNLGQVLTAKADQCRHLIRPHVQAVCEAVCQRLGDEAAVAT